MREAPPTSEPAALRVGGLPAVGGPIPDRKRAWISSGVAAAILLQLVVPLTYYLGNDRYDERFSWRMFSQVRLIRCRGRLLEQRLGDAQLRPRPVLAVLHEAWQQNLERNRSQVVDAFLAHRCATGELRRVAWTNRCVEVPGARIAPRRWTRDCRAPQTEGPVDE